MRRRLEALRQHYQECRNAFYKAENDYFTALSQHHDALDLKWHQHDETSKEAENDLTNELSNTIRNDWVSPARKKPISHPVLISNDRVRISNTKSPMKDLTNIVANTWNNKRSSKPLVNTNVTNTNIEIIPSSQLSEITVDELSSSPLEPIEKSDDEKPNFSSIFETQPANVPESMDLAEEYDLAQQSQKRLASSPHPDIDPAEEEETQIQLLSSPISKKRVRFTSHTENNFNAEIDADLKNGRKDTTFPRPPIFQLPTPQTEKPAPLNNHSIDSWLKKSSHLKLSSETPTRMSKNVKEKAKASKERLNEPIIPKFETYEDFYNYITDKQWQKSDFIVNSEANEDISYAFQLGLRGKERQCIHGKACTSCERFYELAGPVEEAKVAVQTASRHRDKWAREASPPGFWRADMPSTQEELEDEAKLQMQRKQQVKERLMEALTPKGRFCFKDSRYRTALKALVDKVP